MLARSCKLLARRAFYAAKVANVRWLDYGDTRRAAIVRFHSVSGPADGTHRWIGPNICVPPDVFERQIAFLARRYRPVSMDELLDAFQADRPLPRNAAVVTFDDGYRDNYEVAYPILRRHRVPAIFYVATGALEGGEPLWPSEARYLVLAGGSRIVGPFPGGRYDLDTPSSRETAAREIKQWLVALPTRDRRDAMRELRRGSEADPAALHTGMMTWDQVREMRAGGMLFGAHTVSHPLLPSIPLAEAREEIIGSRQALEAELGEAVRHFSYPNPGSGVHWNPAVRDIVREAGFATGVTSRSGYVKAGDDLLTLRRLRLGRSARDIAWDIEADAVRAAWKSGAGTRRMQPAREGVALSGPAPHRPAGSRDGGPA
jgi:peptidoglycan/xylan/chitin deacetylase (PgdA/CDA1 family)